MDLAENNKKIVFKLRLLIKLEFGFGKESKTRVTQGKETHPHQNQTQVRLVERPNPYLLPQTNCTQF